MLIHTLYPVGHAAPLIVCDVMAFWFFLIYVQVQGQSDFELC